MALPFTANCTVDIYRSFSADHPYPPDGTVAAAYQIPGYLKHHVKNGRFGFNAAGLHSTYVLYLDSQGAIRSGHNSLRNTTDPAPADTRLLSDCPVLWRR